MKILADKTNTSIVLQHLKSPIIWLDLDFTILDINDAALKLYQWDEKGILGQYYEDLCEQGNLPCPISSNKSKVLAGEAIEDIETDIEIDSQKKTLLWDIQSSFDQNNKHNGFILIGNDVTELKLKNDKLFELDSVIGCMPNNVYWLDRNCTTLGCNDNVVKFVKLKKRSEFPGITYEKMGEIAGWTEGEAMFFKKDDMQVMATDTPKFNVEEPLFHDDNGNPVYYISSRVPLHDSDGNVKGVVGISTDITDIKLMEQKLAQARKLQEKSQNAKIQGMMEIAAGIAHEIRTPLTSIQCAADAKVYMDRLITGYKMAEDSGLPVESIRPSHMQGLKNIFNSIEAEAKESMNIIDMFLKNLKSMVKEANTGDYQLCSIKEAVAGALARYPFDEQQKSSVVYAEVDDFKFYGVNLLIQHIVFNLIKNALYYLDGNPDAQINIWQEQGEADNCLHFKDTGPGISEYDQTRIFDFGFSKRKDGSGFGLTYCKTTMQQMGGDIAVKSEEGKFTEFILTFPKVVE